MTNNVTNIRGSNVGTSNSNDGGDGMESRVAKLEASVEYIQKDIGEIKLDIRELRSNHDRDFRILFAAIIATALGLAYLMAQGFKWI